MENIKTSLNGFRLNAHLKNVPVGFVNALRRIVLAEIPTVILSNIQILENSSSMTHEMLHHRIGMIPVNVRPEESAVIRDSKLELRVAADKEGVEVTTDDFKVAGPRDNVLLKDRDLDTPLLLLRLKPGESIHIKATLSIVTTGASQVCISTFRNHIDPDVAKVDRDTFIAQAGDDPKAQKEAAVEFDNFHIQRSFSRNKETGRPDWFDVTIESIGVVPAKDLVKKAMEVLSNRFAELVKSPVLRESDGRYRIEVPGETYTVGQVAQEIMYTEKLAEFVSMDIGHPLVPVLTLRFHNPTEDPEAVLTKLKDKASALCENVLRSV